MSRLALAVAAIAFLALPAPALAQGYGPFQPPAEDYGPGITVSGTGFAPLGHRDRAVARAVGDARRRAEAIAQELGVSVGEARAAELSTPFDPRPACVHRHTGRCARLDALSAVVTFAIAGGPTSDDDAREVEGSGSAFDRVEVERQTSPAIRRAFRATRLGMTPRPPGRHTTTPRLRPAPQASRSGSCSRSLSPTRPSTATTRRSATSVPASSAASSGAWSGAGIRRRASST